MEVRVENLRQLLPPASIVGRCPFCGRTATFSSITNGKSTAQDAQIVPNTDLAGMRMCPSPECRALIFFVSSGDGAVRKIYPYERLDFDKTGIPVKVAAMMEEAIGCHSSECYIASAIMIRRTLEEICQDRGAEGKTLHERLQNLRGKVILPEDLFEAMGELKLLGNDAAHVEAKSYDSLGKEEVEIGIALAKEILKAVYQYASIVDRLRSLKRGGKS